MRLYLFLTAALASLPATATEAPHASPEQATRWLASVGTPVFQIPQSWPAWARERERIRAELTGLLGAFPARPALSAVRVLSRTEREGYVLEKFTFDNGVGSDVSGLLFLPRSISKPVPAILYCHWHGGQYEVGKDEMLQTNATPFAPGPALARLGYAVLGIDAYCFGERNGAGPGGPAEKGAAGELSAAKFNLWAGRTLWGGILRDDLTALDYLCSRPEVDKNRIGVTGISMGSTRSWWLMALDERIKADVGVACMTQYEELIQSRSLGQHGIYYFVPGMLQHFDAEAVVACIAPRPLLLLNGSEDRGSPEAGIRKISERVGQIYELAHSQEAFSSIIYAGVGHTYTQEMWAQMLSWFSKHLSNP